MKRNILYFGVAIFSFVVIGSCAYVYNSQVDDIPSSETPSHISRFLDGAYEVRSYSVGNPLCGRDEVVDVAAHRKIYDALLCEEGIVDIQVQWNFVTITLESPEGRWKVFVPK